MFYRTSSSPAKSTLIVRTFRKQEFFFKITAALSQTDSGLCIMVDDNSLTLKVKSSDWIVTLE